MDEELADLIQRANAIALGYPDARVGLHIHAINIEVENPEGFPFGLDNEGPEITLNFRGWHCGFSEAEEALKAFEACFSGKAKLRDLTCLGIPYGGFLELFEGESQQPICSYGHVLITALFLFPFPKKERRFQNAFERAIEVDST